MYKILLVEDDSALRYIYSKMKTWANYGFIISAEASNGKDALKILETQTFDLIITDIRMPFIDGLSLLKKIKELNIDVFSILVSSYNEFEYARQGLILGAFDFIVKPVNEKNLSEVLERAKIYLGEKAQSRALDEFIISVTKHMNIDIESNNLLYRVCKYISENMERRITMEEIAESLQLSKDYFGKTFKQNTGLSFNTFYSTIKIEYAKILIDSGKYKNYEISELLGYSDPDYFTRIFKNIVGTTPANYKKKVNL